MTPASDPAPADAGDGLETPRLVLRRAAWGDLPWLSRLNADPAVMRHLGGPETVEDTRAMMRERMIPYYDAHPGFGVWVTMLKATGEPIGLHLLNDIRGTDLIQVGYRLKQAHWGRGYATEMARALVDYGFRARRLDAVHGIANVDNHASRRALEKSGLLYQGERAFAHPAYARFSPLAHYTVTAADRADRPEAVP